MVGMVGEPSAAGVHAALEWNKDEMGRRILQQKVARLKEERRLAETNKWAGRNSRSAKMQVVLKQALEDWFAFARNGAGGVSVPDLVDSIIMLGLNPDFRQVKRTVVGEADTSDGLLTLRGFTTALFKSCANEHETDRLVRALQGGRERRRFIDQRKGGRNECSKAAAGGTVSARVPGFVERLTVHRRKVLMETVADKFPTWHGSALGYSEGGRSPLGKTRGREGARQSTTPANDGFTRSEAPQMALSDEARRRYKAVWEAVILAQERDPQERGALAGQDVLSKRRMNGAGVAPQDLLTGRSTNSHHAGSAAQELLAKRHAASGTQGRAQQAVLSERRLHDGGSAPQVKRSESGEATTTEGMARRPVSSVEARSTVDTVATERQCDRGQACLVEPHATRRTSAASRPEKLKPDVAGARSVGDALPGDEDWRAEVLRETSERLRGSARRKELRFNNTEARWDNYQAMKKRWLRHTPLSILQGDEPDELNRSYSRIYSSISRPRTSEGTGSDGYCRASASSSRCAASSCRPSTAPVFSDSSSSSAFTATVNTRTKHSTPTCSSSSRCSTAPAIITNNPTTYSSSSRCSTAPAINTTSNSYTTNTRSSSSNRCSTAITTKKRTTLKPLPLGPISPDAGKKEPYPLDQLQQAGIVTRVEDGGGRSRRPLGRHTSSRDYVEVPVVRTRARKGGWQPHLARVPCGYRTNSS